MSESIDHELLKAFQDLIKPASDFAVEYRAYYNDRGEIVSVCSEFKDNPMAENSIVIPVEVYEKSHKFLVINKEIVAKFAEDLGIKPALIKSKTGFKVVKNNPALLIEKEENYTNIEYYDYRNY
jgi:hypothetical protein